MTGKRPELKKAVVFTAVFFAVCAFIMFSRAILPALYAVMSVNTFFYCLSCSVMACIIYMLLFSTADRVKYGPVYLLMAATAVLMMFFYDHFIYRIGLAAVYLLLAALLKSGGAGLAGGRTIYTDPGGPFFRAAAVMLGVLFVFTLIRNAWVSDDAYITLRTVDNFVNGYGLRWNIVERVQSYTHPLWMFLISAFYFFTREAFYTTIAVSMCVTCLAVFVYYRSFRKDPPAVLAGLAAMFLSEAFVEFGTSGLENPLTYLFISLFFTALVDKRRKGPSRMFWLSFIAGLAVFNRMDTLLLFAPVLVYEALKLKKRVLPALAGFAPFILWEIFSVIYYGFPFPNTFYAKAAFQGLHQSVKTVDGMRYFLDIAEIQVITLYIIMAGITAGILSYKKDRKMLFFAAGPVLYIAYIMSVGGDFMSGRFFSAPFFMLLFVVSSYKFDLEKPAYLVYFSLIFFFSVLSPYTPITGIAYFKQGLRDYNGIAMEKTFYGNCSGLAAGTADAVGNPVPYCQWALDGREMRKKTASGIPMIGITNNIGYLGYFAGPKAFIIDRLALADPLLARMPPYNYYVGHLLRALPAGYIQTVRTGVNVIITPELKELYDRLSVVTKGPLFTVERFVEIFKFNTGKYAKLAAPEHVYVDTDLQDQDKGIYEKK